MTQEQQYLFDLQGYIVLEQIVPPEIVAACNAALDRFEAMDPEDYPAPLVLGQERSPENLYISNIMEGDDAFSAADGTSRFAGCRRMRYRRPVPSQPYLHDL